MWTLFSVTQRSDRLHSNAGDAREHNTWINWQINLYSAHCSMSTLSHSLCTPPSRFLHQVAKAHINHWSARLIVLPTCQKKKWERQRLHPGSVYLCYYHRVNREALPFFAVFTEISILIGRRWRVGCLSDCLSEKNGSSWKKRGEKEKPLPLTSCLGHLRQMRDVIDFASRSLRFPLCWQLWANKPVENSSQVGFY